MHSFLRQFGLLVSLLLFVFSFARTQTAWALGPVSKLHSYWLIKSNISGETSFSGSPESKDQFQERIRWWQDAKFGMFIHWGLYSIPADSKTWYGTTSFSEFYLKNKGISVENYEKFAEEFNPQEFDAASWVDVAKKAGMKYIVYVAKHQDGFAMYHSKLTSFNIVDATPFKRDPLLELYQETRRAGLRFGVYYNLGDWNWPRHSHQEDTPQAYADYVKGQIQELLTQYGPIDILWFDRGFSRKVEESASREYIRLARSLQPQIIINNRTLMEADFDTPEQFVPKRSFKKGRPWETCTTLNDSWGYARNDQNWKLAKTVIRTLSETVNNGGNLLLNVGPTGSGSFPSEAIEILNEVGAWAADNLNGECTTKDQPFFSINSLEFLK